ncbi:MAG: Phosphatidylinositol-4-phosphate 5-kinase [Bathelium mastoideum]|nr:MAG: Phosphatidylinositol-4-phosphate 5-kinase [Bathelium mastoideum]
MQATSLPRLGDDPESRVGSSSGQWPISISELAQAEPMSDSERKSNLAASEMHLWWREGSGYSGYRHVAVLLIRWAEELDQLKCGDEARRLDGLFQNTFGYYTDTVELHDKHNANLQLHSAIVDFVKKHDGPNNLIIVYYTGHGSHKIKTGDLILHPTNLVTKTENSTQGLSSTYALWQQVEVHLMHNAKCDALSILDCCFAGDVHKDGLDDDDRTYQLLSAAGKGKTTRRPGPASFTTALIKSLSQLQKKYGNKPFTTLQLLEHIQDQPERRDNPPFLWHRLHRYERPIFLAPLTEQSEKAFPMVGEPSRAFLTLRVALEQETLNKPQVIALAEKITKAAKSTNARVRRVDLVSFSVSTRRRTLLQMIRSKAIPIVRLLRGGESKVRPTQTVLETAQPSTSPITESDSPPDIISPPRGIPSNANEQVQSEHGPQSTVSQRSRKRTGSPAPGPKSKTRRRSV